ncbi:recombinase family protein [Cohnella sp. AR92]|uniref:recombinase family protein n=1 Tax=Cohnella sp. AR92 TaxID=648716 RepID=UPI000F8EBF27|nr:recombinase family protein [Cohnella sp. AR92]RUS43587.1 recombinase family protein [Cohnella sp. AR92]
MRVAAYIRVSTDEQADKGNSLHEQRERLAAYCIAMGWGRPTFFVDDGYSAKDMRRPAAQEMITHVHNNEFDIVLTSKLDRMSRNLLDMLQLVNLLNDHDCNFVSASEGFDTSTAVGRMVLQLLAAFAEFERERISERVKDNMLSLARNTDKALSRPSYGFTVLEGKYSIDSKELIVVETMASAFEQGHGYRMVAKILNDCGYLTRKGKPWDQINVKRVILNPMLSGTAIFNARKNKNGKIVARDKNEWIIKEDNHPAILSKERHQKIIELLNSRKPAKKHADSETYLLTGLIKCGHCGRNMKGNTARVRRKNASYDYFRYVCASYTLGYGCKYHAIHRDDLESEIINHIQTMANKSDKELTLSFSQPTIIVNEIGELKAQLQKIEKRIQKNIDAYSDDLITASDLKIATERAERERLEISKKLQKLADRKQDVSGLKESARKLWGDITGDDRVKAKSAIRQLISEITLLNGSDVSITWKSFV